MRKYDVILCTYNGAYFIARQIESILCQSISPHKIIISDDYSTDNTLDIIKQVCHEFQFYNVEIRKGERKGVVYNFLSALRYAESEHIFFADQDDIWLPNKAEEFLASFAKLDQEQPTLVFSDARLIDELGINIADSFFVYQGIDARIMEDDSILYRNCVQGASCAINKPLQELVIHSLSFIDIDNLYMHDWWFALLARYYGQYQFIEKPLLEYRQHTKNQVGVFNHRYRFIYYITRFRGYLENFQRAIKQVGELEYFTQHDMQYEHRLSDKNKRTYGLVSTLKIILIKFIFRK